MIISGGEAILGPSLGSKSGSSRLPPPEMRISRQKLRPGSGMLSVKVITDGPTRVLQVTDISQQVSIYSILYFMFTISLQLDTRELTRVEKVPL